MSSTKLKHLIFLTILAGVFFAAVSCNSKSEDDEGEIVVTASIVAIKKFYLQANDSVLRHLDSVAFSIDLNTGVIFNADSLPKGTDVSRVIPSITFANNMTKAELKFLKDNKEEVTVDYLADPNDSIDFTHPVVLDVTAADGVSSFTYHIKVNVHSQIPDTLMWAKLATSSLPSRYIEPEAQKTIRRNDNVYTLVEEFNGDYTLAVCSDLNKGEWDKNPFTGVDNPVISSFCATPNAFWLLSETGSLLTSENGENWTDTGQQWINIIGGYDNNILGIKLSDGKLVHTVFPNAEGLDDTPMADDFPISDFSSLGVVNTSWYPDPFALLVGGITQDGSFSSSVWGYDGQSWAIINDTSLPKLESPMMARYVVYRDTPYIFTKRELDIWLLFGGTSPEGEMNRTVYMTYDNGVSWIPAPDMMQLPESWPSLAGADVIVAGYELSADLAEAWTPDSSTKSEAATRTSYTIDGYEISWICPYIYVFGGYNDNHVLSTDIWRGVISRLEFTPLI